MTQEMFNQIKDCLFYFNISYGYKLHYDFNYQFPITNENRYSIVPFDFSNNQHYLEASEMINQGNGDWILPDNIRKIMCDPVFDASLWHFVKDNSNDKLIGVAISTYDNQLEETDIEWFYILPEYHNKGAGRYLLSEIIKCSKYGSDDIRVGGTNEVYKKCGFWERECNMWAAKDGYSLYAPCIQPNILV